MRFACSIGLLTFVAACSGAEIQLPLETNAFKQDLGAEIANANCLICHSVEYVSIQPLSPRAFWKSSVQKMQQKYGASLAEDQIEPLVDYLTRNYGVSSNAVTASAKPNLSEPQHALDVPSLDGSQLVGRYGCTGCHTTTSRLVGPAFREIAAKYKSDPEAAAKINQQIHQGGSGKWGSIIMPPFPQVTASETKGLTEWILSLSP